MILQGDACIQRILQAIGGEEVYFFHMIDRQESVERVKPEACFLRHFYLRRPPKAAR
jgi:hypothetical protein